jgi:hypothetical protein
MKDMVFTGLGLIIYSAIVGGISSGGAEWIVAKTKKKPKKL